MFDDTEIKSEFSLLGLMTVALKLNSLCKLLVEKGVISEDELKKLNTDSAKEITDAVWEE